MTHVRRLTVLASVATLTLSCGILTGPDSPDALSIQRFLATPERVDAGNKVMLLWSVEGAETVTIDHGIGEVDARGSHQVSPSDTTTYTLSAAGGNANATASVRVVVGADASPSPS